MYIGKFLPSFFCFCCLSSCSQEALTIDHESIAGASALPEKPEQYFEVKWWHKFESKELNNLISEALDNNFSLQSSKASIEKARALAKQYRASLLPSLNLYKSHETISEYGLQEDISSFIAAPSITLDIWGHNFSEYKKYDAEAISKEYTAKYSAMTVIYEIITSWAKVVYLNNKNDILNRKINIYNELIKLKEHDYKNGLGSLDAIIESKDMTHSYESSVLVNEASIAETKYEIALLTGRSPAAEFALAADDKLKVVTLPAKGLSTQLLKDRPDIMAAMQLLLSSKWGKIHADTAMLPTFSLSASITKNAVDGGVWNWLRVFTGAASYSIFNGGSDLAEIQWAEALSDQYLASYIETIFTAIKEVKQDLIHEETAQKRIVLAKKKLKHKQLVLDSSRKQFKHGDISYKVVLEKMLSQHEAEISLLQNKYDLILRRAKLYHDLGGNVWSDDEESI